MNEWNVNFIDSYEKVLKAIKDSSSHLSLNNIKIQNRLYSQLESLSWLQRCLKESTQLPPLRNWASSPDVLLKLHNYITKIKPNIIIEFGSGASTLVIADALNQNGKGILYSIEHSDYYGDQTQTLLDDQNLNQYVDLRVNPLEPWHGKHLNPADSEKESKWYAKSSLEGIDNIELVWVDGPPGNTCLFSRYPALPALVEHLTPEAQVWMDDTVRQEEKDICEDWAKEYEFELTYYYPEKGLGILSKSLKK